MKNIHRNKPQIQTFLVWIKYLFLFGAMPSREIKPYVFVAPPGNIEVLRNAVAKFELKKSGGITV
jgi:hypothetical protein